jgi:two-component system, sensor histidine kinase LadS
VVLDCCNNIAVRSTRTIYAWCVGALLWLAVGAAAWAQDVLPASALQAVAAPPPAMLGAGRGPFNLNQRSRYWIDPGAAKTVEQLEAAGDATPWGLREGGRSYRIDGKALWFQFDAINEGAQRWFVELGSSGIDRVQFFYRSPEDARWIAQEAGDTKQVSDWPLPGRLPTFELAGKTTQPVRYWLRIEHDRTDFATPILLYDEASLLVSREAEQFLLGGYFSLAALIAIVAVANAIVYRDRNFAVYGIYVATLAAGQLAYLGVGAQHVWEHWLKWNEMASFVLPGISAAVALWFTRTVTEPARFSRVLDLSVWILIAGVLSAVAVDAFVNTRGSSLVVIGLSSLAVVVVAVLIVLVWTKGDDPHMRLIALGFLPVLVMAIFPLARGFNLIPVSLLTRYGLSIGAALEMPILFYALSLRGGRRREAQVRAAALARNDALTGLAHTRTFLQRLDSALERAASLKHACAMLAVKISNYDRIVSEFGRETGDRVLVIAASLLRAAITDVDLAARVGDHEFALLLEGPATPQDASARAQQIVASGLRSSDALPAGLAIKFHVAVALLPDQGLGSDGSLKWLLEGVNAMRPDSRKLIRPLNF